MMSAPRRRPLPILVVSLLFAGLAAGCLGSEVAREPGEGRSVQRISAADPRPMGDEWPTEDDKPLKGPFAKLPITRHFVKARDGVDLHVWVLRPDLPEGVRAPTVLWSAPYFGTTMPSGDDPALWDNSGLGEAVPVNVLVENGYAVAIMNLRGSGLSGGCFTLFGSEDWDDNAAVVEWLGTQEWSNGRVGMMGLSYHGTTPWQAAVRTPPHLKTIVTAGMINNLYTFFHSPQGSAQAVGPAFSSLVFGLVGTVPPFEAPARIAGEWAPRLPERLCPELVKTLTELYTGDYGDTRDAAFWEDRRIIRDMPKIQASVLLTHGLRDLTGHAMEEDPVWQALPDDLPKRMIDGQWGHMFPNFSRSWTNTREEWNQVVLEWLDYWLKGIGIRAPGEGVVEFQDDNLAWYSSSAWPPSESRSETTFLCAGGGPALAVAACESSLAAFRSAPLAASVQEHICPGPGAAATLRPIQERSAVVFRSEPVAANVTLAGNPFALLRISSDLPGGLVSLYAYEVDGQGGCGTGFRRLSFGSADLRHHAGNYAGREFPLNTPTDVRIDMTNLVENIGPGNRIAVVAAYADITHYEALPFTPTITIHGRSHIVWPVLEGTLGGSAPPLDLYPPRPWVPTE